MRRRGRPARLKATGARGLSDNHHPPDSTKSRAQRSGMAPPVLSPRAELRLLHVEFAEMRTCAGHAFRCLRKPAPRRSSRLGPIVRTDNVAAGFLQTKSAGLRWAAQRQSLAGALASDRASAHSACRLDGAATARPSRARARVRP